MLTVCVRDGNLMCILRASFVYPRCTLCFRIYNSRQVIARDVALQSLLSCSIFLRFLADVLPWIYVDATCLLLIAMFNAWVSIIQLAVPNGCNSAPNDTGIWCAGMVRNFICSVHIKNNKQIGSISRHAIFCMALGNGGPYSPRASNSSDHAASR